MKHKEFVKLFGVSEDEEILATYHCSVKEKGKLFLEGFIYYSQNYLCFFANFLGRERKLVIPWADVTKLERRNTGKVIPNAILVTTATNDKHLFRNFINRHEAFVVAEKIWNNKQLNVKSEEAARLLQRENWAAELESAMKRTAERYDVIDKLGEGGFGLTFVVMDKTDFRQYVLKEICCETAEEAKDAMKEMVLLRLLKHPYIVSYKDFWQEEFHVFIVMEYCRGGDVSSVIDKRVYIPEKRVKTWICQIAMALHHMHKNNVVHRDIKPQNLFLNQWNDIKIGDFGLSTVRKNRKKQHQTAVGTLGYAAPELLKGKPYNEMCDMYALGCSLYEILTLRSVFDDQEEDVFPVPVPQNYSSDLSDLMKDLLHKDPDRRPTANAILKMPFLRETLESVNIQSEIYGELQQRDEENDQLRLKVQILQSELSRIRPLGHSDADVREGSLSSSSLMKKLEDAYNLNELEGASQELLEEYVSKQKGKEKEKEKEKKKKKKKKGGA